MSRRICVVTGTRAEYGLLRWVMEGIRDAPSLELQVVATGMHLSPEFGLTYREIEKDGFRIDSAVEMLLSSDTPTGIAKSVGLGTIGFADAYRNLNPDVVVVLGDRFEILAAAQAAFFAGISITHVSGGEVTEGALDDAIRHCITKLARYHFVAAEPYRQRVIQLGEAPDTVFNVGDPALDSIHRLPLLSRAELNAAIGFDATRPYLLVTYHPATAGGSDPARSMQALLEALDACSDFSVLVTRPNADSGGRTMATMVDAYAQSHAERIRVATSLGQLNYLSAMKHCAAVVGNSSSGIVEAPAMGIPTVNIGKRQHGRLKATSIIDCDEDAQAIVAALRKAVSAEFRSAATQTLSVYGDCDASRRIVSALGALDVDRHHAKRFHDLSA